MRQSLLENVVIEQRAVVQTGQEGGITCSLKETSGQHCFCLELNMMQAQSSKCCWPVEDYLLRLLQLVSIEPGLDLTGDAGDVHGSQVQAVALVPDLGEGITVNGPWSLI